MYVCIYISRELPMCKESLNRYSIVVEETEAKL